MGTTLAHIQQRRKTAAAWTSSNEVLLAGEIGAETDTPKWKLGDGTTPWTSLAYQPNTASISTTYGPLKSLPAALTADGPLVLNAVNKVDATAGARAMTLPSPAKGSLVVKKSDVSANTVTVTGTIDGSSSSVVLPWYQESILFESDGTTWTTTSGHKRKSDLDLAYGGRLSARAFPFYAKGDGTSDDTTALTAWLSSCASGNFDGTLPAGTYKITSGLTWSAISHSITALGKVTIDATAMTSGYALTVTGTGGGSGTGFDSVRTALQGVKLLGSTSQSSNADGICIVDTSNVSMVSFRDVTVLGFRDGWFYGDNTWCISQQHCLTRNQWRYGLNLDGQANAGENYQFAHSTFANVKNTGGTAVAVYSNAAGNIDAYFTACSFDYCDILIAHNGGNLVLAGGHLENDHIANAMVQLSSTSGVYPTTFSMFGTRVAPTEDSSGHNSTAGGVGRDHLIEVTAASSSDYTYVTTTGVEWNLYNRNTHVFKNLSATLPTVSTRGGRLDNGGTTAASSLGAYTNTFVNGDFETSASFLASASFPQYPGLGWSHGGTITYAFDTTNQRTGTRCVTVTGTGTVVTSALQQMIAVTPGTRFQMTVWINIPTYVAGTINPRIASYQADYTTRITVLKSVNLTAATSGWTPVTFDFIVPAGVTALLHDIQFINLNGTVRVDDAIACAL